MVCFCRIFIYEIWLPYLMVESTYAESYALREKYSYKADLGQRIETVFGDFKFRLTQNGWFKFEDYLLGEKGEVFGHYPSKGKLNGAFEYKIKDKRLILIYKITYEENNEKPKNLRERILGQDMIGKVKLKIEELPSTKPISDQEEKEIKKFISSATIDEIVWG